MIQRDETHVDKIPKLFYCKLPPDVSNRQVLLCDPMLATGGSASCAIGKLVEAGVPEKNIIFLNVISCPEGLARLGKDWPEVKIVTAAMDPELNEHKYIVPGLGDYAPIEMSENEYTIFYGNKCRHGNMINDTPHTRVSFDFRILPLDKYSPDMSKASGTRNMRFIVGEYYKELK